MSDLFYSALTIRDGERAEIGATETSRDYRFRYSLLRSWGVGPHPLFLLVNPSTATAVKLDPTVARCRKFALRWGAAGFMIANLYALRTPNPDHVRMAGIMAVGDDNDAAILRLAAGASQVICGWGAKTWARDRIARVLDLLRDLDLYCLRTTKSGQPEHPLYLPGSLVPTLWRPRSGASDAT